MTQQSDDPYGCQGSVCLLINYCCREVVAQADDTSKTNNFRRVYFINSHLLFGRCFLFLAYRFEAWRAESDRHCATVYVFEEEKEEKEEMIEETVQVFLMEVKMKQEKIKGDEIDWHERKKKMKIKTGDNGDR